MITIQKYEQLNIETFMLKRLAQIKMMMKDDYKTSFNESTVENLSFLTITKYSKTQMYPASSATND